MSYLLTEIALEMLGFKFYDTDGQYHLTSFQTQTPLTDLHQHEPTLEVYLSENSKSLKSEEDIGKKESTTDPTSAALIDSNEKVTQQLSSKKMSRLALARLLNKEYERLLYDFINKMKAEQTDNIVKPKGTEEELVLNKYIKVYLTEQQLRLADEISTLRKFRELVESRLLTRDTNQFASKRSGK